MMATELEDTVTCWDCQVGAGLHIHTCFHKLDLTPDQGDTVCLGTAGGRVLVWDTRADAVAVVAGARAGAAVDKVTLLVPQKVPSEANPKVRNHGEGPY